MHGEPVVAGGEFDVGAGDARPGDVQLPPAVQRLAGQLAVLQREGGVDHCLRGEPAAGRQPGVEAAGRQLAEAARVEMLQFAGGAERALWAEIELALGFQVGVAGRQAQAGQLEFLPDPLGFGKEAEGGVAQVEVQTLPLAGQRRGQRPGQAGRVQGGDELPGVEAAGLQVEVEAAGAEAALAGQFAAAG